MPVINNARHELFAQEMASGKTATAAYAAAGFTPNRHNAAKLARTDHIKARVAELTAQRGEILTRATNRAIERAVEKAALSADWVLSRLMTNADRAMQAAPVLDRDGAPTGVFKYDGAVANRALELLGRHLGILVERHEVGDPGEFAKLSDDELEAQILASAETLGIPLEALDGMMSRPQASRGERLN